ncbi:hypothetical protein TELCIR_10501 [Teladorsagia circumcincta]|uniref:7TM GPCR serpentine receptor class x (Srx) domain-containing protein n=1 Tax=Teladorsagia circumcincta TaxID=45464 RepID=A0A2G9UBY9_TELCI|nr:hypothetical protein TELCIR_10501 [Teladorsagia circumcincta]
MEQQSSPWSVEIALFGIVFNTLALITVRMNSALRSSFGLLCLSHCVANMGVMMIFMFWVTPMNFRESTIASGRLGKLFGQLLMFFWDTSNSEPSVANEESCKRNDACDTWDRHFVL